MGSGEGEAIRWFIQNITNPSSKDKLRLWMKQYRVNPPLPKLRFKFLQPTI